MLLLVKLLTEDHKGLGQTLLHLLLRQCLDIIGNTIRQSKNIRCQWLEARLVNCYSIQYEVENRLGVVDPGPDTVTGHGGTAFGHSSRGWLTKMPI